MSTNQFQMRQRKSGIIQDPFWRRPQIGYLVSLSLVGLALLGAVLEQQLGLHAYFSSAFFLLVVVLISLLWGTGPALLAVLVSTLVLSYVSVPPNGRFDIHTWDGLLQLLPFILSGVMIARITAQREAARRQALLIEQELETYTDELELDDRVKSEVLSLAAQELNASLKTVNEQIQVIEHPTPQQQKRAFCAGVEQNALDRIDEEARHLQGLSDDLLSMGSITTCETSSQVTWYDLRDVCRRLIKERSLCQRRPIALGLPSLPVMVQFDRDDLNQVMNAALRHILKCSSPDDVIHVDLSQHEGQIRIQMHNAESERTHEHEQYTSGSITAYHPEVTHLISSDHSDLWLIVCKTIVEWYNGHFSYTTSFDGRKNTCTIELPSY